MSTRRNALLLLAAVPFAVSAATKARTRTPKARSNPNDNGESQADRDRRMARECRNLPNAGACRGFGYGS